MFRILGLVAGGVFIATGIAEGAELAAICHQAACLAR